MEYGTLRVTTPDGQVREYPLDASPVVVGRAESNRVVIDHVSVSRRHARFILDGEQVLLEDLGSASGTFVGGEQIAPEKPELVHPGEQLRFGDASATFMLAGQTSAAVTPAANSADPTPAQEAGDGAIGAGASPGAMSGSDDARRQPSGAPSTPPTPNAQPSVPARPQAPTDQAIVVSLQSPTTPVAAGATVTATFIVENRGADSDAIAIEVQNLPDGWSRVTRPTIQLPAGGRDEVTVVLQPPRAAAATAGEHSFAVAARSPLRGVEVRALGRVTVLPFGGQSAVLTPVRSTGAFTLNVSNEGNSPAALTLSAHDGPGALAITVTPSSFELAPGEQRSARVSVRTTRGRFFGQERIFPFEVEAQGPMSKSAVTGEFTSRPPWLTIRWFAALGALLAVAFGGFVGYQAFFAGDDDAAQASPSPSTVPATASANDGPASATQPAATQAPATARATSTVAATAPTTAPAPTLLPSVTPPSAQSRLGSGRIAQVIAATNLLAEPSAGSRVIQPLKLGDRLIVVTNTPASSTLVITEGLIFWRVAIEGTQTVGWVVEGTAAGDRRFLDLTR